MNNDYTTPATTTIAIQSEKGEVFDGSFIYHKETEKSVGLTMDFETTDKNPYNGKWNVKTMKRAYY